MQYLQYKESKERGSFGFPIERYHLLPHHPRYEMPYHWHIECELIRILEGEFSYAIEEENGVAAAGDTLFVNSGFLHAGTPHGCVYECIVFDRDALLRQPGAGHSFLNELSAGFLLVDRQFPQTDAVMQQIVANLFENLTETPLGHQLLTQGFLYQFFGHIQQKKYYKENSAENKGVQKKIRQLKITLEVIETEYANPVALQQLAQAAGMGTKYFCRFFMEMTGHSPIDYLNYHRIEVACLQLATGLRSITDIAYDCGFNDLSYFIRVFKRYKGITPKQYAKQLAASIGKNNFAQEGAQAPI